MVNGKKLLNVCFILNRTRFHRQKIRRLQNRWNALYSTLRSEFCNYAVGPWASVAGRETALARGNPALKGI